jgi:hypothetical protein
MPPFQLPAAFSLLRHPLRLHAAATRFFGADSLFHAATPSSHAAERLSYLRHFAITPIASTPPPLLMPMPPLRLPHCPPASATLIAAAIIR